MKGQTSIELVATVGIALVLAAPFVIQAQGTMIDISFGSDTAEIQASLDRLAESIRTVGSMGEPSTRRVELRLTRDMENFQVSGNRSFIYTMERSGRKSNFTRIFDSKISANNMPQNQGIYTIEVEAWKDQVNISGPVQSPIGASIKKLFTFSGSKDWNQGFFNRTSADRNDNSGNLGLGYLNGSNPSASSLDEGLVGYWRMDRAVSGSGGTVKDYSGEANDGTTSGGILTGETGVLGTKAFNFTDDDDDYVDFSQKYQYNDTEEFSLSFWINTDKVDQNDRPLGFDTTDAWGLLYLGFDTGNDELGFRGDSNVYLGQNKGVAKPGEGWTHVLVTHNGSGGLKMYENGVQVDSSTSATWQTPDDIFVVGDVGQGNGIRWSGAADNYDGVLDEIRIYDRELSTSDAKNLYISGTPFTGNYTSQNIENSDTQDWKELEIQASINSTTDELTATFETLKSSFIYFSKQAYNSVEDWNQGDFNKTTADEIVTEYNYISELEASTQSGFNEGGFNGTSADRKDNSGDLGLGYRNGSSGDNLVGYWRFDSDSAKDYSGNGNDGTLNGSPTTGVSGTLSTKAFEFDGNNDYIEVPDSPTLDITEGVTISMWLKGQPSGDYVRVLEKGENSAYELFGADGGSFQPWMRINGNDLHRGNVGTVDGSNWVLVTGTYNASTGDSKIYINGSSASTDSISAQTINTNSDTLRIATEESLGGSDKWDGSIDEVQVYNRSLSQTEIEHLYFNGGPFQGNYTAEKIDNNQETVWDKLEVNASVPSDTSVNATFKALDTDGNLVDTQQVDLNDSLHNYSLSVSNSEDAEVFINGTSSNVTKSWEVHSLEVFSSEAVDKIEGLRIGYRNGSTGDNLVGYWRMDRSLSGDGSTLRDYSGENNDGTLSTGGNMVSGVSGTFSTSASEFDGSDDYVDIPKLGFSGDKSITTTAWVKVDPSAGSNNNIFGFGNAGNTNEVYSIRTRGDGGWRFYFWGNDLDASTSNYYGEWTHVAAVYDAGNSNRYIYMNGTKVASDSPSNPNFQDNTYKIGGFYSEYFDGKIDEVRIYNISLSNSEVKDLYFNGRPFKGNYTAKEIDNNQETSWEKVEINASVPSDTNLTAEFEALDSSDNVVDRDYISVDSGSNNKNYSLSVQASEGARLSFNGTSSNVTETWKVYDYEIYSGEREVDESEQFSVQDGLNNYSIGVGDSKDARIKFNGTSSDVTKSWSVENLSLFAE